MEHAHGSHQVRVTPDLNYGHLLQFGGMVAGFLGVIWWQASFQAETRIQLTQVDQERTIYGPLIASLVKSNDIQDERISNMASAIIELRHDAGNTRDKLETIVEQLGEIKAGVIENGKPEKHSMNDIGMPGARTTELGLLSVPPKLKVQ